MSSDNDYEVVVEVKGGGKHTCQIINTRGVFLLYMSEERSVEGEEGIGLKANIFGRLDSAEILGICKAIEDSVVPMLVLEARNRIVSTGISVEEADKVIAEVLLEQGGLNNVVEEAADGNT